MGVVVTPVKEGLAAGSHILHKAEVGTEVSSPLWAPVSGRNSTSGSTDMLRPPRARDRVTMVEVNTTPGRVTAGVGSVSRGAETEFDWLTSSRRPTLRLDSASMAITPSFANRLSNGLRKNSGKLYQGGRPVIETMAVLTSRRFLRLKCGNNCQKQESNRSSGRNSLDYPNSRFSANDGDSPYFVTNPQTREMNLVI